MGTLEDTVEQNVFILTMEKSVWHNVTAVSYYVMQPLDVNLWTKV